MKLGHKPRYPRPQSVLRDIAIVRRSIPTDEEPQLEWRNSFSGTPNMRMRATTGGVAWMLDIYCGHFYRVQVGGSLGEVWRNMPALIGYLRKQLGVVSTKGDA